MNFKYIWICIELYFIKLCVIYDFICNVFMWNGYFVKENCLFYFMVEKNIVKSVLFLLSDNFFFNWVYMVFKIFVGYI